ncbi:MAG: VWA domain-containing protein [Candidatus Alcyoniella australis]|nr:VWA domain-containing protein [Candidatus Alcyoniella australis]
MIGYTFVHPWVLPLGAVVAALMIAYQLFWSRSRTSTIVFSDVSNLKRIRPSAFLRLRQTLPALRIAAVALLFIGLARPQQTLVTTEISSEGIDIMLIVDTSGSMRAQDFAPHNRLEVAKAKIGEFINGRRADRIGLVVFAEKAFTQCPLTQDYAVLQNLLQSVDFGMVGDSTAVGEALALGVERMRGSEAQSKVIVLLTDGQNNAGRIQPLTAAKLAQQYKIKVYTIGVGSRGSAMMPVYDPVLGRQYQKVQVDLDEETLRRIAQMTGGEYFRAADPQGLETIYKRIDQLEKTEIETRDFTEYSELYKPFVLLGLLLLLAEALLAATRFRRLS